MAHIETWYCCPVCRRVWETHKKAFTCRNSHSVIEEMWAVGKGGKAVRIFDNYSQSMINGALREADLSDFIEERKKQLEEEGRR